MVLFPPLSWHVRARPGMGGPRPELSGSHPISTQCLPPTLEEVSAPAPQPSGLGDPSRPSVPPVVSHFLSGRQPLAGYRRVGQGSFKLTRLLSKGGSRGAQPSRAVALRPRESEHKWAEGTGSGFLECRGSGEPRFHAAPEAEGSSPRSPPPCSPKRTSHCPRPSGCVGEMKLSRSLLGARSGGKADCGAAFPAGATAYPGDACRLFSPHTQLFLRGPGC